MNKAVIVSAIRTPIAKKGGALSSLEPYIFGAMVLKEALNRVHVSGEDVDDVILGNCGAGGGNIARLTLLQAGLPFSVPGLTIDRQCGSGINSVILAAESIIAGKADIVLAGGTESLSRSPYLLSPMDKAFDRMPPKFVKRQLSPDHIGDPPMGITAENLVEHYLITRKEQDEFALRSQRRMAIAMENSWFEEQILPISVKGKKGEWLFDKDEHPRADTTLEKLATLSPAFKQGGTVTAGNSSGVNDGASALLIMSEKEAKIRGLEPLAYISDWAIAGVDPNLMGIGPVPAVQKLLRNSGGNLDQFDLIEINEAFAAQVLACDRELSFNMEKVNVNGGAIAHGHPIAATGGMLVTKLIYEMKRRNVKKGLVTACIGGGQGIALSLERK